MRGEKNIAAEGWATTDDMNAFRASANNTSVSGDDARHGISKSGCPKKTMRLNEAEHLIEGLTAHWLEYKRREKPYDTSVKRHL
jgi:hypothetical protein